MTKVLHPKFKGPATSRQQLRSKERRNNVDANKMNMGGDKGLGYYEGMPGVHLDENKNRKMVQFVVQPDGKCQAHLFAHNMLIKRCIEQSMDNEMISAFITSAVVDHIFKKKTPFNWLLRVRYKIWLYLKTRAMEKRKLKVIKELKKSIDDTKKA